MVIEQVRREAELDLIEQYRSLRPGYQNILDDAMALHEQSSTASSLTLPTRAQLDAYAKTFGPDGEIAKRREQASNFTDPDAATQSTVRSIANRLKGVENLPADAIFDYERGLAPNIPAVANPGQSFRDTLEFGRQLHGAIPDRKRKQFDAEYGTRIPGVTLGLSDAEKILDTVEIVDNKNRIKSLEDAEEIGNSIINRAALGAVKAASAPRDDSVQSALTNFGITNDLTPSQQRAAAQRAAIVGAVETLRTSPNEYTKKFADDYATNMLTPEQKPGDRAVTGPQYQKIKNNVTTTAKQKAPNVINNLLALGQDIDTSADAVSSYRSDIDGAINKYVPRRKQSAIRDTFNQKIIEPNVNAVQDYIKKNPPSRLTRGSSEYGYRETLRRMGR